MRARASPRPRRESSTHMDWSSQQPPKTMPATPPRDSSAPPRRKMPNSCSLSTPAAATEAAANRSSSMARSAGSGDGSTTRRNVWPCRSKALTYVARADELLHQCHFVEVAPKLADLVAAEVGEGRTPDVDVPARGRHG